MSESVHSLRSRASGRSGFSGFGAASQSQSHFRSSIAGSSVTLAGATTDRETATEDLLFHASWSLIETSWWWKHVFYPLFHYGIFVQCIFIALDPWSSWTSVPREFVRVLHFLVTFAPFPTTALAVRVLWIISASIVVLSIGNVLLLLILHRSESGQTSFFRNLGLHLWWTSSSLFFIPLMSLLSYPLRCDSPNGRLLLSPDSYSEVDCFGLEQSLMSIFGILLGIIWTYFSSVISLCAYEFRPSQKHSLGGPLVGRFRSILIVSVFLLVFGRAALSHSAILRSLLSLTFGVVLTCSVVYFNFFYLSYTNIIHVSMGIISVGASMSSLSGLVAIFVSVAQHERVGSYIGIGVFILSLFVGPLLSSWFLSMWFSSLHTKYLRTLLEDDEDVGPNLGQHLFRSPIFVELLSRPVPWLPLVDQIHRSITNFELAEELFPKSTFVRVFHLLTLHENIMEHRVILHKLKDIRKDFILSLDYKFILFCIAQSISEVENENTDVGRRVNLIRKRMRRCRAGLRQFFKNLLSENASTDLFPGAIQAIYKSEESCKNHFRHLLRDHPKNIRTLRLFAEFLRDIERDPKTARHYIVLADRYETEGARVSKEAEGLHLSSIDSISVRGSERASINEAARSELTDKESRASSIQLSSVVEKFRLLANLEGIDLENSRVSR